MNRICKNLRIYRNPEKINKSRELSLTYSLKILRDIFLSKTIDFFKKIILV